LQRVVHPGDMSRTIAQRRFELDDRADPETDLAGVAIVAALREMLRPEGEVGTLENVRVSRVFKNTLFLTVSMLDGNRYMGTLSFDNVHFARNVFLVSKEHIRQAIKDIGEIEIA
jgi:hypothetical protein